MKNISNILTLELLLRFYIEMQKKGNIETKLIYILTNFVKSHYKCINESINLLFSVKK